MNTPRTYVTFLPSHSSFAVIHQGMPICADKSTLSEALAAAAQMRVTVAGQAWNGDLGQWVDLPVDQIAMREPLKHREPSRFVRT